MSSAVTVIALSSALMAVAQGLSGKETHCIGPRSHVAEYDFDGDTLEDLQNAMLSVRPTPESDHLCQHTIGADPHGDKALCIGANVDSSCAKAAKDEPLNRYFDCKDCYAGATTDLFYSINMSQSRLQAVKVGFQRTHLRGAVEVHGVVSGSAEPLKGSLQLINSTVKISFKVAKVFPVDITVGMPTVLDYSLSVDGSIDAVAGADLDIDLGDHYLQWTKEHGFGVVNTTASVKVTPVLDTSAQAKAAFEVGLKASAQIDIDRVLWYHLNLASSLPVEVEAQKPQVCAKVGADFTAGHEADLHFTRFGKSHEIAHFGPKTIYHYHSGNLLEKCLGVTSNTTLLI